MNFENLDSIYNHIFYSEYEKLEQFNEEEVNLVIKLKFPKLTIDTCKKGTLNIRTNSSLYRKQIISKYITCPLSGMYSSICEAAHILPYSDCIGEEKYNENNGILLSPNLHKMFDKNYFTIDADTCKLTILHDNISSDNSHDLKLLGVDQLDNMYIKQLDNPISKDFLRRRNLLIIKN